MGNERTWNKNDKKLPYSQRPKKKFVLFKKKKQAQDELQFLKDNLARVSGEEKVIKLSTISQFLACSKTKIFILNLFNFR